MRLERVPLLIASAVALLGFVLLGAYMRHFERTASGGEPIALLALRTQVAAGDRLSKDMLVAHDVPSSYVESRQVRAADLSRVVGVRTAIDLEPNQTLAWTDLSIARKRSATLASRIPAGMRAMGVRRTGRAGFFSLLRPGDRVDVLLTTDDGVDADVLTLPLLQNVIVLAVGDSIRPAYLDPSASRSDEVTLLVSANHAALLAQALRRGDVSLALRNERDLDVTAAGVRADDHALVASEARQTIAERPRIEKVD